MTGLADRVDAGDAQLQSVMSLGAYSTNSASNNIELSKTVQRAGTSHQQQQQQVHREHRYLLALTIIGVVLVVDYIIGTFAVNFVF